MVQHIWNRWRQKMIAEKWEKAIMGSVKGLFRLGFCPEDIAPLPETFGYTLAVKNKLVNDPPV